MKRGKKSRSYDPSINDLPLAILVEVMLKLSAKSVIMCKSVCKTWRVVISDPQFANLYSEKAKPCTLIQDSHESRISRGLYFFEPEDGCEFRDVRCRCTANPKCTKCRVKAELKIPAWNLQAMFRSADGNDFDLVNSCNGLICLSKTNHLLDNVRTVVWNPITGEFTQLPKTRRCLRDDRYNFGFGFTPKHGQYKVFMVRFQWGNLSDPVPAAAQVHTLGTGSWRSVDVSSFKQPHEDRPSYLNGALYWISEENDGSYCLASFNFEGEKFKVYSIPSGTRLDLQLPPLCTKVVGGRLYLYNTEAKTRVNIWATSEYGNKVSCTKLFSVDVSQVQNPLEWLCYRLVCFIDNETVVLFGGPRNEFIYSDRSGNLRIKRLKYRGRETSSFEVISFTPSFISLKDIAMSRTVKVLDVKLGYRGGKLKLLEETDPLFLGKQREFKVDEASSLN